MAESKHGRWCAGEPFDDLDGLFNCNSLVYGSVNRSTKKICPPQKLMFKAIQLLLEQKSGFARGKPFPVSPLKG